jgi:ectoine hydroxylase
MPVLEDVYPSRRGDHPEFIDRIDPVVYGTPDTPGPLTSAQLASYAENGFLAIPSLFDPQEIEQLDSEILAWTGSPEIQGMEGTIVEPGSHAVRSVFQVHQRHPLFGRLARDLRLLDAARQILGGGVYMHQSRVNLKPGFSGKEFYWHSDFETWHVEDGMPRMRALSVSLALTENYPFNGPLMLIPRSHYRYVSCVGETPADHYKQSLRKQEYGVPDPESLRALTDRGGIAAPVGPAGTAVFFDCNTMHGSNSNITPYPRRNVFFVYNSVENRLQEPFCGLAPRPEHIASRVLAEALEFRPHA